MEKRELKFTAHQLFYLEMNATGQLGIMWNFQIWWEELSKDLFF